MTGNLWHVAVQAKAEDLEEGCKIGLAWHGGQSCKKKLQVRGHPWVCVGCGVGKVLFGKVRATFCAHFLQHPQSYKSLQNLCNA